MMDATLEAGTTLNVIEALGRRIPVSGSSRPVRECVWFKAESLRPLGWPKGNEQSLATIHRYEEIMAGHTRIPWRNYRNDLYITPAGDILRGWTYLWAAMRTGRDIGLNVIVMDPLDFYLNHEKRLTSRTYRIPPYGERSNRSLPRSPHFVCDRRGVRRTH